MSAPTAENVPAVPVPGASQLPPGEAANGSTAGATLITDDVVATVAGTAARGVDGVHALGFNGQRPISALRETLDAQAQGLDVRVTLSDGQAELDVAIIADWGVSLPALAAEVRGQIREAVHRVTGVRVASTTITVTDVYVTDAADGGSHVE